MEKYHNHFIVHSTRVIAAFHGYVVNSDLLWQVHLPCVCVCVYLYVSVS